MSSTDVSRSTHPTMQPQSSRRVAGVHYYSRSKRRLEHFSKVFVTILIFVSLCIAGLRFAPFQSFESLRSLWVTSAMTTMSHQYLATWFFSKAEIQTIMDSNKAAVLGNSDIAAIQTSKIGHDNGIQLIDISQSGFKGYLLEIDDPARVQVAATQYLGQKGERTQEIAQTTGALAVINGGEFNDPEGNGNGGRPLGILISNGKILYKDPLKTYNIIGFNRDNVLVLGNYSLDQIKKKNIRDAVSFSPFLVVNGKPAITQGDGGWGLAPRTAIGQTRDGKILMLVIDGRQIGSIGATLKNVQDIMLQHGAYNVANLDGGASSVLYYNNEVVNHPSSSYGERNVPSFFIVR
ncbi:MAG: phosphodiester glycosidase family protein [Bacillota bacterium]|nr:phosphodiester glycosidase family protein [Bacillota bacterium]